MASIELPSSTTPQGIALAREVAEVIARHFSDKETPNEERTTARPREAQTGGDPGGLGPFGPCPKCRSGSVVRKQTKDGRTYLQCSDRDYQDKNTCQFSVWNADQIEDYFAGKPIQFKPFNKQAKATTTKAKPAGPVVVPNREIQDVFKLIDKLNEMKQPERAKVLKPFGYTSGSYVMFLNGADKETVAGVAKALESV